MSRMRHQRLRDTQEAARDPPIENTRVDAIKPLLCAIHARIEVLVEHKGVVFLSPTQDRPLLYALPGHTHVVNAVLGGRIIERDGRETIEENDRTNEIGIFRKP